MGGRAFFLYFGGTGTSRLWSIPFALGFTILHVMLVYSWWLEIGIRNWTTRIAWIAVIKITLTLFFWWAGSFLIRKRRATPTPHQFKFEEEIVKIIPVISDKWTMFLEEIPFQEGVPLATTIEMFAIPAISGIMENSPEMRSAPPRILWTTIFTAILESRTHSADEVNAAIFQLQGKYSD